MVEKSRTFLLYVHVRWHDMVDMELWTFAVQHVVTKWNNTPRLDLDYRTPGEIFNGTKRLNQVKIQLPFFIHLVYLFTS